MTIKNIWKNRNGIPKDICKIAGYTSCRKHSILGEKTKSVFSNIFIISKILQFLASKLIKFLNTK